MKTTFPFKYINKCRFPKRTDKFKSNNNLNMPYFWMFTIQIELLFSQRDSNANISG